MIERIAEDTYAGSIDVELKGTKGVTVTVWNDKDGLFAYLILATNAKERLAHLLYNKEMRGHLVRGRDCSVGAKALLEYLDAEGLD
jgi:hypothetical protein